MSDESPFRELIGRVRTGDHQAAEELVRRYEPVIRMEVRLQLRDLRLRRFFDSMDICQSVLADFFFDAAEGRFDLDEPGQLAGLLLVITQRKVAYHARKRRAGKRDYRRELSPDVGGPEIRGVDQAPSPSWIVMVQELFQESRRLMTEEERCITDLHTEGHAWAEIARRLGGTPQARRKQYERAVNRVALEMGLKLKGGGDA